MRLIPRLRVFALTALILAPGSLAAWGQPATLVKDVNLTREDFAEPLFISPAFAALGTTVFFVHNDGIHGYELWKTDGTAAGTVLVKDLCPGTCWSRPFSLTPFNGEIFFIAADGVHGHEIWRTNGTAAGTALVVDLKPGLGGGATTLFPLEDALYFGGDDGVNGRELWRTDGTAEGTLLVADIRPGAEGSDPFLWIEVSGKLLVLADDGVTGREPWLSDGTGAGTALLKDVLPGAEGSSVSDNPVSSETSAISLGGGAFLFVATDGVQGLEIWHSDGTEAGTTLLKDINPGNPGSSAYGFTRVGDLIVFAAGVDFEGVELWATDGTEAGTALLKDIRPGAPTASPRDFRLFNGQVYFIASNDAAGRELWRTDGTEAGTVLVKDIHPGTADAFPPTLRFTLTEAGPALVFFADDGVHGVEPWKSDGTEAGTVLVKDIEPGPGFGYASGSGSGAVTEEGTFIFHGATSAHGIEPWKSNGTAAGTVEIRNAAVLKSSLAWWQGFGAPFQQAAGKLLMEADDGAAGFEPWVSDGTSPGTQRLGDLAPGAAWSTPISACSVGATTLLVADQGRLWTTDGTPAGTAPFQPHGLLPGAANFAPALGILFFSGEDSSGAELWRTDATEGGTQRLFEINPGAGGSFPSDFTDLGSVAVFTAFDGVSRGLWRTAATGSTFALTGASVVEVNQITPLGAAALFVCEVDGSGVELCRTDGSLPGTILLKEIRAGGDSSSPAGLTRAGGQVFFFADDGATGAELWVSDGTEPGTVLVEDIHPGGSSKGRVLGVLGDLLVFVADDCVAGPEPWVSDGTPDGTFLLWDVYPGLRSSEIEDAVVAGGRLYFVADDGAHGRELWVTDGTIAGTRLAHDVVPGPGSPVIRNLAALGHLALFSADDGVHGQEVWRSNGRSAGTFLVQDIAPGALHSSPGGFAAVGDNLFFAANDNVTGFELWKAPRGAVLATFQDVASTYWAWELIEALAAAGITTGCAPRQYCPTQTVSRAEMAVFLERGIQGADFTPPPATGTVFTDVPASYWAAAWIEQLAADGITTGCAPGQFCPDAPVNRSEMAVFLLRAKHGAAYIPPPATGTVFTDVPADYWAAAWIEQLAAEGITTGCAPSQYCPGGSVSRDQMAAFLARTFGLL